MNNKLIEVIEYFRPQEKYFWKWADNGSVVEWTNGNTICYREDLVNLINDLSKEGLPPLGALLMVLAGCKKEDNNFTIIHKAISLTLRRVKETVRNNAHFSDIDTITENALAFINIIKQLPVQYVTGENRIRLLHTIFENNSKNYKKNSGVYFLNTFNSGRLDNYIFNVGFNDLGNYFLRDMECLQECLQQFPDAQVLETKVRTGLRELPIAIDLNIPEKGEQDLLEQLAADPETAGLAKLTTRLIAAINIPMHTRGNSDQLFGGVADITNRGNFDRLLLSELAYDDLLLMARLANNEALYLRREELPATHDHKRAILIDSTIKMWGTPRVFAMAAALACSYHAREYAATDGFVLGGFTIAPVDIHKKEGVLLALETLDASLNCWQALQAFINNKHNDSYDEICLISTEESMAQLAIELNGRIPVNTVCYLLSINREGDLHLHELIKGQRKPLSTARFDLEELLFSQQIISNKNLIQADAPAIMKLDRFPFFYPASKLKFDVKHLFELKKNEVIAITHDYRLLYWNNKDQGADELISSLEKGIYHVGFDSNTDLFLLVVRNNGLHTLYNINVVHQTTAVIKISQALSGIKEVAYDNERFYIKNDESVYSLDVKTGKIHPGKDLGGILKQLIDKQKLRTKSSISHIKKLVNNGYGTINNAKTLFLNQDKQLVIGKLKLTFLSSSYELRLEEMSGDRFNQYELQTAQKSEITLSSFPNPHIRFLSFEWKDGSKAIVDSRGLLHLQSSDKSLPQISLILINGKPLAGWAADGTVSGTDYFIKPGSLRRINQAQFYSEYIDPYIKTILRAGNN